MLAVTPTIRIQRQNDHPLQPAGTHVLYWMIASRRGKYNFGLQRAVEHAQQLVKPLVILEALRCDYRWASDRIHQFVLQGMIDNDQLFSHYPVTYYPYVEPQLHAGQGLLTNLAKNACVVVTDDFPCFFLPRMVTSVANRLPVRMESVDSNGLLPLRATQEIFTRAHALRRYLQKHLLPHLMEFPSANPLASLQLPRFDLDPLVQQRWPRFQPKSPQDLAQTIAHLPIDHRVGITPTAGGYRAAESKLAQFVESRLKRYAEERNEPEQAVTSELSPYLHFGHISVHEVFDAIARHENWNPNCVAPKATGSREGWWGMSTAAEGFLDELITWRELGYNLCWQQADYDQFHSLPDWAQQTLGEHAGDPREHLYRLEQFESARTHDPLWNAAQRQLAREGTIHNYLRMLWGKKILEWSRTPEESLDIMIELNNKYALDGRNPNSYSGIFWVLGRYDRPWGPERQVFGKIRYMTSENTARKVRVKQYLAKYAENPDGVGRLFDV